MSKIRIVAAVIHQDLIYSEELEVILEVTDCENKVEETTKLKSVWIDNETLLKMAG